MHWELLEQSEPNDLSEHLLRIQKPLVQWVLEEQAEPNDISGVEQVLERQKPLVQSELELQAEPNDLSEQMSRMQSLLAQW